MPLIKYYLIEKKIKTVRAKKKLGQHFLKDINIAKLISDTLTFENYIKSLRLDLEWEY